MPRFIDHHTDHNIRRPRSSLSENVSDMPDKYTTFHAEWSDRFTVMVIDLEGFTAILLYLEIHYWSLEWPINRQKH